MTVRFQLIVESNAADDPQMKAWDLADSLLTQLDEHTQAFQNDEGYMLKTDLPVYLSMNPDSTTHGILTISTEPHPDLIQEAQYQPGSMVFRWRNGQCCRVIGAFFSSAADTWTYYLADAETDNFVSQDIEPQLMPPREWRELQTMAREYFNLEYNVERRIFRNERGNRVMRPTDVLKQAQLADDNKEAPF